MRTSVVGLLKDNVANNAENICKLTHYDPRCVGSCVIVSSIIHALVFEDRILDEEDVIGIANNMMSESFHLLTWYTMKVWILCAWMMKRVWDIRSEL